MWCRSEIGSSRRCRCPPAAVWPGSSPREKEGRRNPRRSASGRGPTPRYPHPRRCRSRRISFSGWRREAPNSPGNRPGSAWNCRTKDGVISDTANSPGPVWRCQKSATMADKQRQPLRAAWRAGVHCRCLSVSVTILTPPTLAVSGIHFNERHQAARWRVRHRGACCPGNTDRDAGLGWSEVAGSARKGSGPVTS